MPAGKENILSCRLLLCPGDTDPDFYAPGHVGLASLVRVGLPRHAQLFVSRDHVNFYRGIIPGDDHVPASTVLVLFRVQQDAHVRKLPADLFAD